jgi:CHAT domain-containing protein
VGNGLLNILPIHASGYHDSSPPNAVLEFVISSYAPTVKSLAYSRERNADKSEGILQGRAILIAMPVTPGQNDLVFVETEIQQLELLFSKSQIDLTVLRNPMRIDVLSTLPEFGVAHFSCHGISAEDPSKSSLLLKDWKNSLLTVSDLTSLNIKSPKFAFLSACHTSAMRDVRLLDESINLSSAVQLSGYPSVVGSLWEVDEHSTHVAKVLYECILSEGVVNAERAAEGLHKAVSDLRDRTRTRERHDPLIWAPYVHVGI